MSSELRRLAGRYLPITVWLPTYRPAWLTADAIAGITVWGMVVPEAIAYSFLSGAPAQAGLYTLLASLSVYAILGTSRQVVCAATSATSIITAAVLAPLVAPDPSRYGSLLAALVLTVGLIYLVAGVLRLGFVATFISKPVMTGFVFGLAIYIAVNQLPKLLGISRGEGETWQQLWHIVTNLNELNWPTFIIGGAGFLMLLLMSRYLRLIPSAFITMVLGIIVVSALGLASGHGVEVVGDVPTGLPSLASFNISGADVVDLLPGAFSIALVALFEAIGAARTLAERHNYQIDIDQELIAKGVSNLGSGFMGGLVAASSVSSSEVNDRAGARSELSSLVAFAMVVLTLFLLTPFFLNLPQAILAAIVIHAVMNLMQVGEMKRFYRWHRTEFWMALVALLGVLTIGVVRGLLIAVIPSLLLLIRRASRPRLSRLGRVPGTKGAYGSVRGHPGYRTIPGLMILRFDMPLFFANADDFRDRLRAFIENRPRPKTLLVDLQTCDSLDISSIEMLKQLIAEGRDHHVELMLAELAKPVCSILEKSGLLDAVGRDRVFDTIDDGVKYYLKEHPGAAETVDEIA